MLGVTYFKNIYQNRRVLVTGHTGFKGSWLALWLCKLGAEVTGVSLAPSTIPNHWGLLELTMRDKRVDIRDFEALRALVSDVKPEIVFHLAAQPLVRHAYREPLETWSTNVMGTVNVLEACRQTKGVEAIVVVTTDKCYENREWPWGYRENDPLGGYDPYSASKAGSELVAASYRSAFFNDGAGIASTESSPLVATARAGNVIGGGDWSANRLIPDLVRSISKDEILSIRSPASTRPWQHVLESLSGYLLLGQNLLEGNNECASAWNFGPEREGTCSVSEVLDRFCSFFPDLKWHRFSCIEPQPHEAGLLYLDSSKARLHLGWKTVWNFESTVEMTAKWYHVFLASSAANEPTSKTAVISREQLQLYEQHAFESKQTWVQPWS